RCCVLLGCCPLLRDVLTQSTIDSFGVGKKLVQVWVNQDYVGAFTVAFGVLPADTRLDQALGVLLPQCVFVTLHKLFAPAKSFDEPRSSEFGLRAQYRTQPGIGLV